MFSVCNLFMTTVCVRACMRACLGRGLKSVLPFLISSLASPLEALLWSHSPVADDRDYSFIVYVFGWKWVRSKTRCYSLIQVLLPRVQWKSAISQNFAEPVLHFWKGHLFLELTICCDVGDAALNGRGYRTSKTSFKPRRAWIGLDCTAVCQSFLEVAEPRLTAVGLLEAQWHTPENRKPTFTCTCAGLTNHRPSKQALSLTSPRFPWL